MLALLLLVGLSFYLSLTVSSLAIGQLHHLSYAIYLGVAFSLYLAFSFLNGGNPLAIRFRLLYPLYTVLPFALLYGFGLWLGSYHPALILLILVLIWVNDVMAYFVGRSIGRRKLAPKVSPGKTWEGTWGGWISAAVAGCVAQHWLPEFEMWQLALLGLLIASSGTLGDLYRITV